MLSANEVQDQRVLVPVTIAASASLSNVIDCGGLVFSGLFGDPAAWTAASITFAVSDTLAFTNSYNLFDFVGTEVVMSGPTFGEAFIWTNSVALQGGYPNAFRCWRYIKVRSGTSGTPVVQVAQRNLQAVLLPMLV